MNWKKLSAWILAAVMLLGLTACSNNGSTVDTKNNHVSDTVPDYINTESQMPIVKEGTDITLKVMIVNGPMYSNMNSIRDVYFTNAYEKLSGVKIEWIEVASDAFADQLALRLTTGDLPDIILKGGVSNSNQLKYGEQGYFLNLMDNNLLENYAPNYWALCQQYPEILSSSMMADGSVYSLGMIRNSTGSTIASKLFFNQEWLDRLGLSVPTTAEEFYHVLKAFKENDPNGNGRNDEIGLYIAPSTCNIPPSVCSESATGARTTAILIMTRKMTAFGSLRLPTASGNGWNGSANSIRRASSTKNTLISRKASWAAMLAMMSAAFSRTPTCVCSMRRPSPSLPI